MRTILVLLLAAVLSLPRPEPRGASASPFATVQDVDSDRSDSGIEQQIVSRERAGLDALKAGDLERFGNLTADEAIFVDAQGAASKTQVLKNVAGFTLTDYQIEDVKFARISANAGLISYKLTERGNSHGRAFAAQVYVSSIWKEQQGKWVCLFSQETAVKQPAPAE